MKKLIQAYPVASPSVFNSSVDIIIPFHGQYERVSLLIESIFRFTRSNYYRICIVDDASPNAEFIETIKANATKNAQKRRAENVIQTIRLDEQRGFAGAMKAGFDATTNPYVCFINSDCQIEDVNWLRSMGECLLSLKEMDVRMVSPTTNNVVGNHSFQIGDKSLRVGGPYILKDPEFLSMYCFLCHRELFNRCRGFIKEYPYGFYEDKEFAARMRHYGFKQAVCRESWIRHEGQVTVKSLWRQKPELRDVMEKENLERCNADMKKLC